MFADLHGQPTQQRRPAEAGKDVNCQQGTGLAGGEAPGVGEEENVERAHPAGAKRQAEVGQDDPAHGGPGDQSPVFLQLELLLAWHIRADPLRRQGDDEPHCQGGEDQDEPAHGWHALGFRPTETRDNEGHPQDQEGPQHAHGGHDGEHPRPVIVPRCQGRGPGGVRQVQDGRADIEDQQPEDQSANAAGGGDEQHDDRQHQDRRPDHRP